MARVGGEGPDEESARLRDVLRRVAPERIELQDVQVGQLRQGVGVVRRELDRPEESSPGGLQELGVVGIGVLEHAEASLDEGLVGVRVRGGRALARPREQRADRGCDALGHLVLHLADALPRELVALAPDLLAVGDALDASREATAPSGPLEGAADRILSVPRAGRAARLAHRAPVDHAQPRPPREPLRDRLAHAEPEARFLCPRRSAPRSRSPRAEGCRRARPAPGRSRESGARSRPSASSITIGSLHPSRA